MEFTDHITRVHREVRDRGATKAVILSRRYDTTVEDLWETCTVAEERFTTSDDGADLLRRAGTSWAASHTAAGADPEVARAASERTVAFYSGSAQPG